MTPSKESTLKIIELYSDTSTKEIADMLGMTAHAVRRTANRYGLTKSEAFMETISAERTARIIAVQKAPKSEERMRKYREGMRRAWRKTYRQYMSGERVTTKLRPRIESRNEVTWRSFMKRKYKYRVMPDKKTFLWTKDTHRTKEDKSNGDILGAAARYGVVFHKGWVVKKSTLIARLRKRGFDI